MFEKPFYVSAYSEGLQSPAAPGAPALPVQWGPSILTEMRKTTGREGKPAITSDVKDISPVLSESLCDTRPQNQVSKVTTVVPCFYYFEADKKKVTNIPRTPRK